MSWDFPDAWRILQWPEKRAELSEILNELSDRKRQDSFWMRGYDRDGNLSGINPVINFLFDDNDFIEKDKVLGTILFDENEYRALIELVQVLDLLIAELGDAPTSDFVCNPKWNEVVLSASNAREILGRTGAARWR